MIVVRPALYKDMLRVKKSLIICSAFFLALGTLSAEAQIKLPPGVTRIDSVEGVTEYQIANGLLVLLLPDQSKATITVNVTYLVGSRQESYGETGMAHLLEHMMFKGTPAHPHIPDEIAKHGAHSNASTSYDRTNYFETFAATNENLEWALTMESDRMVNSLIAKKDLDSEMTVVRNEFEKGENDPENVLNERVIETAYLWHNYGHPTIGSRSDIENVPIERLQAFYHKYYRPDDAALIIAGKFDEAKALDLIQNKFGSIPKPKSALVEPYTEEPTQDGQREVVLRRVGDVQSVMAAYHIPADGHPDTIALGLLADVLSDPASGRLRKRLIDTKLAVGAGASLMSQHDPGLFQFSVTAPKNGNVQTAREELLKVAQTIPQEPIPQAELDRTRAQTLEGLRQALADPAEVASLLSENVAVGDWRLLFWERDQMKNITVEDLSRVAGKYLVPSNLTVGIFIPDDKPVRAAIPATPDYKAVLKGYKGEQVVAAGEQFDPSPANIEAHTLRSSVGLIKLGLLPKKTRGNLVNATLLIHFGTEESLRNRNEAKKFVDALLMRGTAKHDMAALQDVLTNNKTQMSVSGGPSSVMVSLVTDHDHLAAAMRLAAEILQQPSFPEKEFDELKSQTLASIESSRSEPQTIASVALQRALSPYPLGHIRYIPTLEESAERVKATTLDDVKKFYKDFYGIGAAEMVFVGDFDPDQAKALVTELFSNWKSPVRYERVPFLYKAVTADNKTFNTPDKENAVLLLGTNLEINDDNPDYPALVLGNYILGGGFLNSRLLTRIRQKEGLSYTVSSRISANILDKVGSFSAFAICAPQNKPKVEQAFHEEISRSIAEGFTTEEIAAAKSGYLQARQVDLAEDGNVASILADRMFYGRDFRWEEKFNSKIRSLTSEQISKAMRQYIDPGKFVVVAAGDFARRQK